MRIIFSLFLSFLIFSCSKPSEPVFQADIIIYGGTSAGITAAVQAKKMGKSVIVVSPDVHLGGLSSGGLGFTDTGNKAVIGGLAREFYHRVYLHYEQDSAWKWQKREEYGNKGQGTPAIDGDNRTMWIFEPHVAEQIFEDFVKENQLEIHRDEWLDRDSGITKKEGKITEIRTLSGKTYQGKVFIDATYEGDLMAAAGVSYHVGRESNSVYGETWNGVQVGVYQHRHYFMDSISAYRVAGDSSSGLLPEISAEPPGQNGEGDGRLQAYNFRMALSRNPDNRVPFAKPENYDPARYELLGRVYAAGWDETFWKYDPIPNLKTDTNNHGPFSTDYIGKNYDYPEANYTRRKEIIKEHEDYQKGLMYFLANDLSVPEKVRYELANYGLAKDEFVDNGNWPHQIYVREARRMIGAYVMTEHDVLGAKEVPQPVGMGSYSLDSHNTQRFVTPGGFVQNEGDIGVHPEQPYSISYGTLVPKKEECSNLLVPVCVSSSHTAFGSIRMEPVFMILGQSAAAAAALAIDGNQAVQALDYEKLRQVLLEEKQVLEN
ncbi:FAD-dependent oxidoreductase [Algoriphagus litoralis]|uniref:FAD-dependent oxidoreductase n=1 Tax=Algoriphagus litoralis TaxID=2202829 RepID=UPI000DBA6405|nr:FAD-dependent oxidoreductase [Algoriphagus litoralis]